MYVAELHGKLSSKIESREDILTSNVFSFFKYANRKIFLKNLLNIIGIKTNNQNLVDAEFIFWPRYDNKTEPDVVIVVGDYYVLFEAKFFSGFTPGTSKTKSQLVRELNGGMNEAKSLGKQFLLVAVTADSCFRKEKFTDLGHQYANVFRWINWQGIAQILLELLETKGQDLKDYHFARDLYDLLVKKRLRRFESFNRLCKISVKQLGEHVFFSPGTSRYRGHFIGFSTSLPSRSAILAVPRSIFYQEKSSRI